MKDFKNITIIGMGLIGGSIALGLKHKGFKGKIIGEDVSKTSLEKARDIGAIDESAVDLQKAVKEADLVILAVPVGCTEKVLREIAPHLSQHTVVTDVGSVKEKILTMASEQLPRGISFIGGHPMAGSEKEGIGAASPTLFENAYYFLTPTKENEGEDIEKLKRLVQGLGAYPVVINPKEHNIIVARISHMPHLMAVLLVNMMDQNNGISHIPFAGGGFRDTTRIAAGNPAMWRDILLLNKQQMIEGIEKMNRMLENFKALLIEEKREEILQNLTTAKIIRDSIPKKSKDYIPDLWDLIVDIEDRPGVLGEMTGLLGGAGINIKEIEILHARQEEQGAVRMAFATESLREAALKLLRSAGFKLTYGKGEEENAHR